MTKTTSNKNPIVELLLCIFLGMFGAHRFYTRKFGTAILYLLTFGLFYIGWVVDIILIVIRLTKRKEDAPAPVVEAPIVPVIESRDAVADASPSSDAEPIHEEKSTPSAPAEPEIVSDSDTATYVDKTYKVAGTTYYTDNILNLAIENTNYDMTKKEIIDSGMTDEKIWKYEFYPSKVELVPEPENPYDKNAIKVLVDGEHVGHIKAGSCVHLLKVIQEDGVLSIDCEINGGPYKIVTEEYDFEKDKDVYTLDRDERNYSVTLTIREANQHQSLKPSQSTNINHSSCQGQSVNTNLSSCLDQYVLNPKTMVLHRSSCPYAQKAFTFNKSYTGSRSAAISIGYKPCKHCKP